jgi:hypothetical protein
MVRRNESGTQFNFASEVSRHKYVLLETNTNSVLSRLVNITRKVWVGFGWVKRGTEEGLVKGTGKGKFS